MKQGHLTLVEVVAVVVMFAVLIVVAAWGLNHLDRPREWARRANCVGNQKQIGLSLQMYSGDFDGFFPNKHPRGGTNFDPLVAQGYIQDGKVWWCPSSAQLLTTGTHAAFRYIGSGLKDDNPQAKFASLAYDRRGNHPPRHLIERWQVPDPANAWCNVLYADGHVEGGIPGKAPYTFNND
jgi:prepilin-type processing-associated H-X9-DG protein